MSLSFKKIYFVLLSVFLLIINISCTKEKESLLSITANNVIEVEIGNTNFNFKECLIVEYKGKTLDYNDALIDTSNINFNKVGTYVLVVNYSYDGINSKKSIEIKIVEVELQITASNMQVEVGDINFNFSSYITIKALNNTLSSSTANIDTSKVDFTKEGTYQISVSYLYNQKTYTKTFDVIVVRTIEVIIDIINAIEVEIGNITFDFKSYLLIKASNTTLSNEPAIIDTSKVNFNKEGNYQITISYLYNYKTYTKTFNITIYRNINIVISTTKAIEVEINDTNFNFKNYLIIKESETILSNDSAIVDASKVNFTKVGNYQITVSYNYDNQIFTKNINISIIEKQKPNPEVHIMTFNLGNNTYGKESSGIVINSYTENSVEFDGSTIFKTEESVGAIRIGSGKTGGMLSTVIEPSISINKIVLNAKAYTGSTDKPSMYLSVEDEDGKMLAEKKAVPTNVYADYTFYLKNNNSKKLYIYIYNNDYERFYLNSIKLYNDTSNMLNEEEINLITSAKNKDYSNMTINENFTGDTFYLTKNVVLSYIYIQKIPYPTYVIINNGTYTYYDDEGYKHNWKPWEFTEYIPIFEFSKIDPTKIYKEENGFTVYDSDLPGSFILYVTMVENLELISLSFTINNSGYINSVTVYCLLNNKHYNGTFTFTNITTTIVSDYPTK